MTDIVKLKHLLNVISLKQRDLAIITTELKHCKLTLQKYVNQKNMYMNQSGIITNIIMIQQNNINILEAYDDLQQTTVNYTKICTIINHLTEQISLINIEDNINQILNTM